MRKPGRAFSFLGISDESKIKKIRKENLLSIS